VARRRRGAIGVKTQRLRGSVAREPTKRQREALAAYVEGGGSITYVAGALGIRPGLAVYQLRTCRRSHSGRSPNRESPSSALIRVVHSLIFHDRQGEAEF
jgi:hypothetical protein